MTSPFSGAWERSMPIKDSDTYASSLHEKFTLPVFSAMILKASTQCCQAQSVCFLVAS